MKKIFLFFITLFTLHQTMAQVKVDRSHPPQPGPAPVIAIAEPTIFTLPNGMTVLVVENHKLPSVRASLSIDAGPIQEGKKAGVLQLMGEMLEEGTTNMPKARFDEAVDMIGASVSMSSTGGSVSSLTRYFNQAFMLMADAVKNPAFPQESLDKIKSQELTGLKSSERNAKAIAERVVNALNYGKQTAMGEFVTEESIKGITLNDIREAYKNYITPSRSYLTFVGDIKPAEAKELVNKAFGKWSGKKLELSTPANANNPDKTEIDFVDVPTAVQCELSFTNLLYNPMHQPDYPAILLANQILGGGAESKLFMNLREKHGFTYGSYSSIGKGRFQTILKASAAVRNDKADSAVAEMMGELKNLQEGKISQEELNMAKAKYNGTFAIGMEDPNKAAMYATDILINNLPKDFYKTFLQKINAVTLADIQRVAEKYFTLNNGRIIMVGNGEKILPNLLRLGYPIKKFDKYANPIVEKVNDVDVQQTPKTTEAVSAYSIIENYLTSIGGKEEVKKVNTILANLTIEMMGMELKGTSKKMNPNKEIFEIQMNGNVVSKVVFDGIKGYSQNMGKNKDFDTDEVKERQDNKAVIKYLYYNSADYKTDYLGTGKVAEEDAYKLKILKPSGNLTIAYFSIKTGLLLKEENTVKVQGESTNEIIEYSNYKKVGNVFFPFTITRTIGERDFNIKISDIKINTEVSETDFQ